MSSIPGNTSTKSTISTGQTLSSALTAKGDSDWYRTSLVAGYDYGFRLSGDGSANSLVGGDLYILDAYGNEVTHSSGSTTTNSVSVAPTKTGTYYVDVREYYGNTGNYRLSWIGNDTIMRNAATTTTLTAGKTLSSAIDVENDSDWVKVELKAGLQYGFTLSGDGSANSLVGGDIYIRDADGNEITRSGGSSTSTSISFLVTKTSTYFVEVKEYFGATGKYKLTWFTNDVVVNNTSTSARLLDHSSVTGTIDSANDSDWYAFSAQRGVTYRFTLSGTGSDALGGPSLTLQDANGNRIDSRASWNGPATFEWTSNADQRVYLAAAGNYSSDTGTFQLTATSNAKPPVTSNDRVVKGTSGNDTLVGGNGGVVIYGYAGNDSLTGGKGNDVLLGGAGRDRLVGGAGSDTASYADAKAGVVANLANRAVNTNDAAGDSYSSIENLIGSRYNDSLTGNAYANVLRGGTGRDRLEGGGGKDTLEGGSGADLFVYRDLSDSTSRAFDIIRDFSAAEGDRINLSLIDADSRTSRNDQFTYIGSQAFSGTAGELRFSGGLLRADVNGDRIADLTVQLEGVSTLRASSLVL